MARSDDTIFALSSGAGRSGVAVFRLSGARAHIIATAFCGEMDRIGQVYIRPVRDPETCDLIDKGVVFLFAGPASFTGEDMAEIQLHGSLAVIASLSDALSNQGIRPADAGEFTERAFRNGKLDLAQAEALADLIDAETIKQHKQSLGQLGGQLSEVGQRWRQHLIGCLAPLEAAIDFPDEAAIPAQIEARARPVIEQLIAELQIFLDQSRKAQRVRKGVTIVLLGAPNAGKSSLLNWLAKSDIAIVSDTPGTTRDAIECRIELAGVPVTVIDTAGLRGATDDAIEQEGIRRALAKAAKADLRIGMVAADDPGGRDTIGENLHAGDILLWNKNDLKPAAGLAISLKTGAGLADFLVQLEAKVGALCGSGEEPALTRARHVYAVEAASMALNRSLDALQQGPEMAAQDIHIAIQSLGQITGDVGVEDVLGEIFASFCIGK
ncbi:MAG: tRNA uridine-5-carboxymethylaminomethyl(34) synthesis GTPase MnmE [Parvularculaceae bacterium]